GEVQQGALPGPRDLRHRLDNVRVVFHDRPWHSPTGEDSSSREATAAAACPSARSSFSRAQTSPRKTFVCPGAVMPRRTLLPRISSTRMVISWSGTMTSSPLLRLNTSTEHLPGDGKEGQQRLAGSCCRTDATSAPPRCGMGRHFPFQQL